MHNIRQLDGENKCLIITGATGCTPRATGDDLASGNPWQANSCDLFLSARER